MLCEYVTLEDGRQVHYRRAGSGPAMILLHPSPQCSEVMISAITAFSEVCECFALDTPGYGLSDDIGEPNPDMGDYAESVIMTADALGMESFYLYGAATGSQVAIELGKRYPDRIKLLMLDSNGHVSDEGRARVLDGYFPDVTPQRDGGHLLTYWDMCRHLFVSFPWQSRRAADRLCIPLPPVEFIQSMLLRYLRAGTHYYKAYRPAFETETRAHMDGLDVPSTMMRWEGSIALAITDALIEQGVPDCMEVLHAGPAIEERFAVQVDALRQAIDSYGDTGSLSLLEKGPSASRLQRRYFGNDADRLHAHVSMTGEGVPLVMLHGALASGEALVDEAGRYVGQRPVMLVDIPGHGASALSEQSGEISVAYFVDTIAPAIKEFSDGPVDLTGNGLGGAIATALTDKINVNQLRIIDPIPFSTEEQASFKGHGLPKLSPRLDGTHLAAAWGMLLDDEYFWPWFDKSPAAARSGDANLSPEYLHQKAVDLLRTGSRFEEIVGLEVQLDWKTILGDTSSDYEIICTDRHPCPDRLDILTH